MVYLALCIVSGLAGGLIGRAKGSSFFVWLIISAVAPVIGPLAALLYRSERDELRRQCPGCGKVVPIYDALCTRCGTELEFPDEAIAPASSTPERATS